MISRFTTSYEDAATEFDIADGSIFALEMYVAKAEYEVCFNGSILPASKDPFSFPKVIEEVWRFGLSDLLATVGGNLGLFLGWSAMTLFDSAVGIGQRMF